MPVFCGSLCDIFIIFYKVDQEKGCLILFCKVNSGGLKGMDGFLVQVEADVGNGLPDFSMVGYLAGEVREAGDRVRTAIKNSGFRLQPMKVMVNLSPADVRKDGTAFDLPIALAVLGAYGLIDLIGFSDSAFIGELSLDGSVKPVKGILALVAALKDFGVQRVFIPSANVNEGLAVDGIGVVRADSLRQVMDCMKSPQDIEEEVREEGDFDLLPPEYLVDFSEVGGQTALKRATEIAVAGHHNILYIGPPGSGKSMVAKRIPTIMPSMSREEQIELSKIYSICGLLPPGKPLLRERPFRAPHHTASPQALAGGGRKPMPGEVSLASKGVLFLDELPEFCRAALEILRQPLEERRVSISRVQGSYNFPADVMVAAAMNPCPCGYFPDRNRCSCNELQVKRYLGRISRALLDRIDICVEASPAAYQDIRGGGFTETSAAIRERVERVREIQQERFAGSGIYFNSEMGNKEIQAFCILGEEEEEALKQMFKRMHLSARGCSRILKVARTIADLDGGGQIQKKHLAEAASYRELEEEYWGRR